MTFERKVVWVIVPLDPAKGARYTKPVHDFVGDYDDVD